MMRCPWAWMRGSPATFLAWVKALTDIMPANKISLPNNCLKCKPWAQPSGVVFRMAGLPFWTRIRKLMWRIEDLKCFKELQLPDIFSVLRTIKAMVRTLRSVCPLVNDFPQAYFLDELNSSDFSRGQQPGFDHVEVADQPHLRLNSLDINGPNQPISVSDRSSRLFDVASNSTNQQQMANGRTIQKVTNIRDLLRIFRINMVSHRSQYTFRTMTGALKSMDSHTY